MPSKPRSPLKVTRSVMSTKTVVADTAGLLAKTRTRPVCSTTNQRVPERGAWNIATGLLKAGKPEYTRCRVKPPLPPEGSSGPPPQAPSTAATAIALKNRSRKCMSLPS